MGEYIHLYEYLSIKNPRVSDPWPHKHLLHSFNGAPHHWHFTMKIILDPHPELDLLLKSGVDPEGHTIDLLFTTHVIKLSSLTLLSIPPQVIQSKHNSFMKIKN